MMNSEFHKDKTEFYTRGLLAVAAVLGVLVLLRIAGFFEASSEAQVMAARVNPNGQGAGASDEMSKLLASSKACAEELKKKNLFVPAVPRQHPVSNVLGILGDEALINGNWYKAGASVGEAKILAVGPTKVRIAWNGQEKEFFPIGVADAGGPPGRSAPARPGGKSGRRGGAPMVISGPPGGQPGKPALSDEERNRRREQFQSMSPEERQRARDEMRQRLGATAP